MNREELEIVKHIKYKLSLSEEELSKIKRQNQEMQDKIDTAVLFLEQYFADDEQEPDLVAGAYEVLRDIFSNSLEPREYIRILRKGITLIRFEFQKMREKV